MDLLDARSRTYSAAICAQIRSGSLNASCSHPRHRDTRATRATYHNVHTHQPLDLAQIKAFAGSGNSEDRVLVIENVDLTWCIALGLTFGIDHSFFAEHASNPPGNTPWEAIIGDWSGDRRKPSVNGRMSSLSNDEEPALQGLRDRWHVDGVLEYEADGNGQHTRSGLAGVNFVHRPTSYSKDYGWTAGTRISYILAKPSLYLFLVDTPKAPGMPMKYDSKGLKTYLRLPLGLNRGGLLLPNLLDHAEFSLYWSLHRFFSHPWHHHVLFSGPKDGRIKLSPETIFHLLISSTWATNLRSLDRNIKRTGLEDIRRPSISINETLHDQRAELLQMLWHVKMTLNWLPPSVRTELDAVKEHLPASKYIGYPDVILQDILDQANVLEKFLMDSFTLLMSSISVLEAGSIKEQTQQGQMITRLAFLYVPLSFVTSIFGMNVREINGSPLPMWVPIAAFLVVSTCTLAIFFLGRWKQASR